MFYNIKIAFRNLRRNGLYSWINVIGLAIGLSTTFFIAYYILQETRYDDFHEHGDYIYRVSDEMIEDGHSWGENYIGVSAIGPALKSQIAGIEDYTRVSYTSRQMRFGENSFSSQKMLFADTSFFSVFTFPLTKGDPKTALAAPYSVVLTENTAKKLFGDDNPMTQTILIDGDYYTVAGVAQDPPLNSDLTFEALLSFSTLYRMENRYMGWNGGNQYITYIQLFPQADLESVKNQSAAILYEHLGKQYEEAFEATFRTYLRPLKKLHLHYNYESGFLKIGLLALLAMTALIVTIATINFVNLTAARSLKRIKEAGVRKILGSKRADLARIFLSESLLVSGIAFACSFLLLIVLEPLYVRLSNTRIDFLGNSAVFALLIVFVLALLIGVVGGSYPAAHLSSLSLEDAAKGGGSKKQKKHLAQNVLIVLQLTISVVLLTSTFFISRQLSYVKNKAIGFDKEHIIVVPTKEKEASEKIFILKERFQKIPGIIAATATSEQLVDGLTQNGYSVEGIEQILLIHVLDVDEDFLKVYNAQLKSGRFFTGGRAADKQTYVVNEQLAALFGNDDEALGKHIARNGKNEIIGIVNNFHFASMYQDINPLIITFEPEIGTYHYLSVKYDGSDVGSILKQMERAWNTVNPNAPFEYHFFDTAYENQYQFERYFQNMFLTFAIIAILLSVLGMLSLTAYTAEQRKKEIGIRKVLGASVPDILRLLLRRTVWQVVVANIIAAPIALWAAQMWLNNFAYRIRIEFWVFLLAFLISLTAAVLTVLAVALKAAREDPVKAVMNN